MADPEIPAEVQLSPTGKAIVPQAAVRYVVALIGVAILIQTLPDLGIDLPAAVMKIDKTVLAIGVLLGITSQGLRK